MDKDEADKIAVDYLNERGCVPVSATKLAAVHEAVVVAGRWLDSMKEHTDCCGTKEMRQLILAISDNL